MRNRLEVSIVLLAMCVVAGPLRSQTTSPSVSSSATVPATAGEPDTQQTGADELQPRLSPTPADDTPLPKNTDTAYVAALDGTGLISQDEALRGRLLLGANWSGGYDTNPNGLANGPKSGAFVFSPFVGLQGNRESMHYVVQYQPTFRHYTSSSYDGGSIQVGSGSIAGYWNERWRWDAVAIGRHGQESIGMLAPQQSVPVGDVPGSGSAGNAFNPNANTITSVNGRGGIAYQVSERDSVGLSAENAYSSYNTTLDANLIGTASARYMRASTPALQWISYGSATRYYGFVHCYAFGAGIGLEWKPEEHTYLRLSGGPEVNSSACGRQQGFTYDVAYSHRMTPRSQIYVLSTRAVGTSDLGPGLWQQTAAVGYQHDFEHRENIAFDLGYLDTTGPLNGSGYSQKYVDGIYTHVLGHGLRAILSYRWWTGNAFPSDFTRTTALFSIAWTPTAGHLFQ